MMKGGHWFVLFVLVSLFISLFIGLAFMLFFTSSSLFHFYPSKKSRYSITLDLFVKFVLTPESYHLSIFFGCLMIFIGSMNLLGNVPGVSIPALYYFYTSTLSGVCWLALMLLVLLGRVKDFVAHMLPYGSPVGLYLFLPIVELFSQMIRPLTLMIRLSTNLAAGHIMLYMFSFFSLSSLLLTVSCSVVLSLLFVLELVISLLQAYIFSTLVYLYIMETL